MRKNMGTRLPRRTRQTALRAWGSYLLALMAWVAAVVLLALLGAIICASITWYDTPLYRFLQWVKDYIFFVGGAVVLAGWVVISYFFVGRPVEQLALLQMEEESLVLARRQLQELYYKLTIEEITLKQAKV